MSRFGEPHEPCENPRCGRCFVQPNLVRETGIAVIPFDDLEYQPINLWADTPKSDVLLTQITISMGVPREYLSDERTGDG